MFIQANRYKTLQRLFSIYFNPQSQIEANQVDKQLNAALGCVMGAFIGDSIGSTCEFLNNVTHEQAKTAMEMRGGGVPFKRAPGQITDDSEMAFCLSNALVESGSVLNLDKIAK